MVIRVAVVDDQELVRHGFAVMLSLADDMEVVGQAADGAQAVALVKRERPDVVLMDIHMPEVDGLEATRRILQDPATKQCRVLILTTFDLDAYVYDALQSGASGFLLKDTSPDDLLAAVRVVAQGDALLAPKITRRLITEFVKQRPADRERADHVATLTERECEVFEAVARGAANADIAEQLHMSYGTVKTHVSHLLTKLGCSDRAQLVMVAYESGFVSPGQGGA
ncbi:MAG: response regulator transcription factor [Actinomycetia bacterium]|nr:response regulator transcription factor [Actinomycetes bacterium]MCP5033574.1 response regulator transcription factor [Actinomycetes bacterium]